MTRYQHIDGWRYPNGVQLAVNFTLDFDAQLFRRVLGEPALELAQGEFGGRTGIWRLLELFHRHQIGLTIFTPGRIAELYPASLREATRCGFEIANHMWEHRVPAEPDLEWDHLRKTTTALEAISGRRPVGTRSHHRRSSLVRDGYVYTSSGAADEIPYYVTDGDATVLNLPFHYALDDAMYFHFGWVASENAGQRLADCDAVHDIFLAHFERLYADAKYMNICVHDFVSGRAMRVRMLDRLITEMKRRPGVWFPTCETGSSRPRRRSAAASRSPFIRTFSRGAGGSGSWKTCWRARRANRARGTRPPARARAGSLPRIPPRRRCDSIPVSGQTIPAA